MAQKIVLEWLRIQLFNNPANDRNEMWKSVTVPVGKFFRLPHYSQNIEAAPPETPAASLMYAVLDTACPQGWQIGEWDNKHMELQYVSGVESDHRLPVYVLDTFASEIGSGYQVTQVLTGEQIQLIPSNDWVLFVESHYPFIPLYFTWVRKLTTFGVQHYAVHTKTPLVGAAALNTNVFSMRNYNYLGAFLQSGTTAAQTTTPNDFDICFTLQDLANVSEMFYLGRGQHLLNFHPPEPELTPEAFLSPSGGPYDGSEFFLAVAQRIG